MKLLVTLSCCLFFSVAYNQNIQRQAVYLEAGKNGLLLSGIYDYQIAKSNYGFRAGAGSNFAKYLSAFTITTGAYKLFGNDIHFFETGIDMQYLHINEVSDDQRGIPLLYPDFSIKILYPSFNLGYRRSYKSSIFRIGFSPGVIKNEFIPGGYISFGFKW